MDSKTIYSIMYTMYKNESKLLIPYNYSIFLSKPPLKYTSSGKMLFRVHRPTGNYLYFYFGKVVISSMEKIELASMVFINTIN